MLLETKSKLSYGGNSYNFNIIIFDELSIEYIYPYISNIAKAKS